MKALAVLLIYVTPFVVLGIVARRFSNGRIGDVDMPNVRDQAGAKNRKRRVSFLGSVPGLDT
jgi:hypothetical protein